MTPTIVLPDGDPHMAALLSRPDFAARLDHLGGARLHADLPAARDCGIAVANVARYGDAAVAEHALALALALAKNVVGNDRAVLAQIALVKRGYARSRHIDNLRVSPICKALRTAPLR